MMPPRPVSPAVEQLDDRLVPATVFDLTTHNAEVATDGFIARQVDAQPTGTGYLNSFVRVQSAAAGGYAEQGYNTTARPLQFDENNSPQFTRGITLGEVPQTIVNGVVYREFLLDVNQKSSAPYLSVDQVQVFLGGSADLTGYDTTARTLAGLGAVFDLDANGDVSLKLDYRLNSGSGSGDMTLLIPEAAFAGVDPGTFVYLYSKMGELAGATANAGFEEWAVKKAPTGVTAGNSSLSGYVWIDANQDGVRDEVEGRLGGVFVHLRGVNDLGESVDLVVQTDANGFYKFDNLRAGVYSIWEEQPLRDDLIDGAEWLGTLGGQMENDRFFDILLGPDEDGFEYNFTEYFSE
ncbi:MAG: MSCRAMM family adhesin SdrC [Planctomycetia bacterium]|nr:MSCRAMM family adhesin SdrC [Planctomycetia bacterium]